jgi:hypothetical protein
LVAWGAAVHSSHLLCLSCCCCCGGGGGGGAAYGDGHSRRFVRQGSKWRRAEPLQAPQPPSMPVAKKPTAVAAQNATAEKLKHEAEAAAAAAAAEQNSKAAGAANSGDKCKLSEAQKVLTSRI